MTKSHSAISQIEISQNELPSIIGTKLVSEYDTTENVIVDVGDPGENQHWEFMQQISGIEISTEVVPLDSTPYSNDFPNSNWVIKYNAGLLDLIYSDIFPQIEGDIYFYQQITPTKVFLLGTGFISSFLSASAEFDPPNVLIELLPTQYLDTWITKSKFSISKDTLIAGNNYLFTLSVNDSAHSIIDAWGTITLPIGTFDCLRMKSYVTMNEVVSLNNIPIRTKNAHIINYNWIGKNLGIIARVASHTGEQNDKFINARLFTRLRQILALPVELVSFNCKSEDNVITLLWRTSFEKDNFGFEIERKSKNSNFQKIAFIKASSFSPHTYQYKDKNLRPGKYQYRLKQIDFNGDFKFSKVIETLINYPQNIRLKQNYPNPFNPSTIISFDIPENSQVTLKIYNLQGKVVRTLVNERKSIGYYSVKWNGKNNRGTKLPSGIYIYSLEVISNSNHSYFTISNKMVLSK